MLEPALSFLQDLSRNNDRVWFEAHRGDYERAKEEVEAFFFGLFDELGFDRGGQKPSFYFHRIYRDVRFAKGKPPYKDSFSAVLDPRGKKAAGLGAYFHLQPGGESVVAGGLWAPEPAVLKKFRLDMEDGPRAFRAILQSEPFRSQLHLMDGQKLVKVPKGFREDHPAADLLKLKQVVAWRTFTDAEVTAPAFRGQVIAATQALAPFLQYLEEACELG